MDLATSIAIVTGASRGLGAAVCKALIEKGTKVYGLARSAYALTGLQENLGDRFIPVKLDISDRKAVRTWVDSEFNFEKIPNILINNAGAGSFGKIDEMPAREWDTMIDVNLNGLYNITAAVVSLMKKGDGGYIINIGSILGTTTRAEGAAYSATKYAIRGFSESLMKELRGDNIKVTCINPGSIDTNFFNSSGIEPHSNMLQPDELAETIVFLLRTPANLLIDALIVRPLDSRNPKK